VYEPKPSDLLKFPLLSVVVLSTFAPEKLTRTSDKALPLVCLAVPLIVPEEYVVKPVVVVYALASELLELSVTEVVIWILYVVTPLRLLFGVILNVLSLLEDEGAADILMQVVKLSEDSRKLPEQVVLSVFVVIVLVDTVSLNDTATVVEIETSIELSVGLTEETVGAVVTVDTAPNFS
jgi:hypothetical protein